jgi:methionine synthase II (cobalamin-independent)
MKFLAAGGTGFIAWRAVQNLRAQGIVSVAAECNIDSQIRGCLQRQTRDLGFGVMDQQSDAMETPHVIRARVKPAIQYSPPERLLLISERALGHLPAELTRATWSALTRTCRELKSAP